jgi:hypothetical protein
MPNERQPSDFRAFAQWVAKRQSTLQAAPDLTDPILIAARRARDEFARALQSVLPMQPRNVAGSGTMEVLELLAAASTDPNAQLPEMLTPRGFRVTLAYDEGTAADRASICVLVRCPPEMIEYVQGKSVYLWSGTLRFELGQFDVDGKAIGTLPAGIEITLADFATGSVQLEAPSSSDDR